MSYISRQEFEFLGEPIGDCVTTPKLGGGYFCGGGGGGPSSSTVTQTNLPEYLSPYVLGMMGQATQQLFQTTPIIDPETGQPATDPETGQPLYQVGAPREYAPWNPQGTYTDPYGNVRQAPGATLGEAGQFVAGFNPLQQNAMGLASWMGTGGMDYLNQQYGAADTLSGEAAAGGRTAANQAGMYGASGSAAGQLGQNLGIAGGSQYGGMGAGFGQSAANLANYAPQYGEAGATYGREAQRVAGESGGIYGGMGAGFGQSAADLARYAPQYGEAGATYGREAQRIAGESGGRYGGMGAAYGQSAASLGQTASGMGDLYERMVTDPSQYGKFMSPYMENVVAKQQEGARRQADISAQSRGAAAARAGAFGGARQAIENAEADRALQSQLQNIEAQGLQKSYEEAQQNIGQRAQLGLQGIGQAGQMYGLGMQGAGMGLQGLQQQLAGSELGMRGAGMGMQGLGQAGQLYGVGMQGAGMGLQGLQQQLAGYDLGMRGTGMGLQGLGQAGQLYGVGMQGAGLGLQGVQQQLAGTAQGMQGAGMGLQGVQAGLGGYGLMGGMGQQLGNLAGQRFGQYKDIAGFQYGLGEQARQREQQVINQAIQNFAMAQETPYQRLSAFNALLRGYSQPGQTMTQYQAQGSPVSQIAGLGLAGAGLSGVLGKKAGGVIKESDGIDQLALRDALAGALQ